MTVSGSTFVVVEDASPLGAGFTFNSVDRLLPITGSPVGQLRVYGRRGYGFYPQLSDTPTQTTYTSPPGDNGTLVLDKTTSVFTYTRPDGRVARR